MNAHSEADEAEVVVECDLPDPPEKVWRALTEPDLVAQWLAPEDEHIDCEVIDAEPHRSLTYRWQSADDGAIESYVTFELRRTDAGGTHLRLIHTATEATVMLAQAA